MTKFNTKAITAAVLAALAAGDAFEAELTTLQKLLKGADREAVKAIVAPIVATKYNEAFVDGKWADSDCAAKRKANRIIGAIAGNAAPAPSNKVAVNKALVKQMATLLKGMDTKVVNATIAAVKAALK
jgi:hypothetical protein